MAEEINAENQEKAMFGYVPYAVCPCCGRIAVNHMDEAWRAMVDEWQEEQLMEG